MVLAGVRTHQTVTAGALKVGRTQVTESPSPDRGLGLGLEARLRSLEGWGLGTGVEREIKEIGPGVKVRAQREEPGVEPREGGAYGRHGLRN